MNLSSSERRAFIDQIGQLPAQLVTLTASLSREQLNTHYIAREWTVAQNIHHLADSHMNSYIRCKLIMAEDKPTLKPYDQNVWAEFSDAQGSDISDSLAILRGLHARWVIFWNAIPDTAWERTAFHPENGVVTLESLLEYYARHGLGHIDQITRTLAAAP